MRKPEKQQQHEQRWGANTDRILQPFNQTSHINYHLSQNLNVQNSPPDNIPLISSQVAESVYSSKFKHISPINCIDNSYISPINCNNSYISPINCTNNSYISPIDDSGVDSSPPDDHLFQTVHPHLSKLPDEVRFCCPKLYHPNINDLLSQINIPHTYPHPTYFNDSQRASLTSSDFIAFSREFKAPKNREEYSNSLENKNQEEPSLFSHKPNDYISGFKEQNRDISEHPFIEQMQGLQFEQKHVPKFNVPVPKKIISPYHLEQHKFKNRRSEPPYLDDGYISGWKAGFNFRNNANNNSTRDAPKFNVPVPKKIISPYELKAQKFKNKTPEVSLFVTDMLSLMGKQCSHFYPDHICWLSKKRCSKRCRVYCLAEVKESINEKLGTEFEWIEIPLKSMWLTRKNNCKEILHRHKHNSRHVIRNLIICHIPKD